MGTNLERATGSLAVSENTLESVSDHHLTNDRYAERWRWRFRRDRQPSPNERFG